MPRDSDSALSHTPCHGWRLFNPQKQKNQLVSDTGRRGDRGTVSGWAHQDKLTRAGACRHPSPCCCVVAGLRRHHTYVLSPTPTRTWGANSSNSFLYSPESQGPEPLGACPKTQVCAHWKSMCGPFTCWASVSPTWVVGPGCWDSPQGLRGERLTDHRASGGDGSH